MVSQVKGAFHTGTPNRRQSLSLPSILMPEQLKMLRARPVAQQQSVRRFQTRPAAGRQSHRAPRRFCKTAARASRRFRCRTESCRHPPSLQSFCRPSGGAAPTPRISCGMPILRSTSDNVAADFRATEMCVSIPPLTELDMEPEQSMSSDTANFGSMRFVVARQTLERSTGIPRSPKPTRWALRGSSLPFSTFCCRRLRMD